MSLSVGLGIARSGLASSADQTALVSRNVANSQNANATRKIANVITAEGGGARVGSITRVTDASLQIKVFNASSSAATQKAIAAALDLLDATVNDPETDSSPASLVQKLADALQQYSSSPSDDIRAQAVVRAANDLAIGLNVASEATQTVREQADADIAASVDRLNGLLARFETVNNEVLRGSTRGDDITDQLDARDQLLTQISQEIGIRGVARDNNDIVIFTDGGATLFEKIPRTVSFEPTPTLVPGLQGNAVYVDGAPITAGAIGTATNSGKILGLVLVRDDAAVTYQRQLDEIARGLITVFAESDQSSAPSNPDAAGLFTYSGGPGVPAGATIVDGLAVSIKINPNVDPSQGGLASRLRDGGVSDPSNSAYVYNTEGAAGFSGRIQSLIDSLLTPISFDPQAEVETSSTVAQFATSSVSWLQDGRQTASDQSEYLEVVLTRANDSLRKVSGVSLDDELTTLLQLEKAYQASARLITTINGLLDTLLQVGR